MPSYEKWGCFKIMMEDDNIEELRGAIKNALEHGHNLEKIKQSFINAGYPPEKVEQAAQNLSQPSPQPQPKPSLRKMHPSELKSKTTPPQPPPSPQPKKIEQPKTPPSKVKPKKSKLIIILIILSVIILIGSALLGLFWDRIF